MADITRSMLKNDTTVLAQDEDYLVACRVLPKGSAFGIGVTAIGGIAGATAGGSIVGDAVSAASQATDSEAAPQMAFGLTTRRIVVWRCSPVSGKPADVIGEIALDSISSAAFEKSLFAGTLTLDFTSGKTAEFTMVKADKPQVFAEALQLRL